MSDKEKAKLSPCEFEASDLLWKLDEVVSSSVEAISPLVDRIMKLFKESCCPPEHEFAVEMALREALANAVIHGNRGDSGKQIRICCACDAKRGMIIVVKDQGTGFDPAMIPSPLEGEQIHSEHGRGIYLINLLMDEVQFLQRGTEIHIRKSIS